MKRIDCGLLKRNDARDWKHWWTVRGHQAVTESTGRAGILRCWLTLRRWLKDRERK